MKKSLVSFLLIGIIFACFLGEKQLIATELLSLKENSSVTSNIEKVSHVDSSNWHPSSTSFPKTNKA